MRVLLAILAAVLVVGVGLGMWSTRRSRGPVRLTLQASARGLEGAPDGPTRFIAELPGAVEGRVSSRDHLQISYVGLDAPAYAIVVALDEAGAEHQYVPPTDAEPLKVEPATTARPLGPAFYLGRQRPGRFRLFAVFSPAPVDARAVREAAARAAARGQPGALDGLAGVIVSGSLVIEP